MLGLNLVDLVSRHPVAEHKRSGFDYDMADIQADLRTIGATPDPSTVYKAIKGMGLEPNARGYYEAPQVAVLLGWYKSPNKYKSYGRYIKLAGQALHDSVKQYYQDFQEVA